MPWQQLLVRLDAGDVARAEALLQLAGAEALALNDAAGQDLLEPAAGSTPLWRRVQLRALFPADTDIAAVAALLDDVDSVDELRVAALADADWEAAWRQRVEARAIGTRLLLTPPDHGAPAGDRRQVKLHMGLAFGTGEHPTTALCLAWLDAHVVPGSSVLDYGCGSGVLAIAALRLGAARAWATDFESQALDATAANARLNGVAHALWIGLPDALPAIEADVTVANILAGPLASLAGPLAARTAPGGHIVLSGILAEQADGVVSAYAADFDAFEQAESGGWVRIAARRREPA